MSEVQTRLSRFHLPRGTTRDYSSAPRIPHINPIESTGHPEEIMNTIFAKKLRLQTLPLAIAGATVLPATAQQLVLEEVVVTAQKRAQSLSDVPLSVNAVTGERMQSPAAHSLGFRSSPGSGVSAVSNPP